LGTRGCEWHNAPHATARHAVSTFGCCCHGVRATDRGLLFTGTQQARSQPSLLPNSTPTTCSSFAVVPYLLAHPRNVLRGALQAQGIGAQQTHTDSNEGLLAARSCTPIAVESKRPPAAPCQGNVNRASWTRARRSARCPHAGAEWHCSWKLVRAFARLRKLTVDCNFDDG